MPRRVAPPPSPLSRGDRVRLDYDAARRGVVVVAGPEQSEVLLDGEKRVRVFINSELIRSRKRAPDRSKFAKIRGDQS